MWKDVKLELRLSTYVANADLKGAIGVDTAFAKSVALISLKSGGDKLDIDDQRLTNDLSNLNIRCRWIKCKLRTAHIDLKKIIDIKANDVFWKKHCVINSFLRLRV